MVIMKFVVDASVIIAVIVNEPHKDQLVEITKGADLLAPASVHWEIGNAFSAMLKKGRVSIEQVLDALKAYHQIPIRFTEVELGHSLEIASEGGIYAYDAYILRCAGKYNAALISLDRKLIRVARGMDVEVVEVME